MDQRHYNRGRLSLGIQAKSETKQTSSSTTVMLHSNRQRTIIGLPLNLETGKKKLRSPPRKPNLRQRLFAKLTFGQDQLNYALHHEKKVRLFEGIAGTVLEIGPGTGVNLQFLDKGIEWIGIEPNEAMHPHLSKQAKELGHEIKLYTGFAEGTGIANNSVEFVLSTLVLCSDSDLAETLREI